MLIGELAERTGTSERLLRYYERAGLLRPERLPNGYRVYADSDATAVRRIRALLAAGLPTRVIRQVLPCTTDTAAVQPCPGVFDALRDQLRTLDERSAELAAAREVLRETIASAEGRTGLRQVPCLRGGLTIRPVGADGRAGTGVRDHCGVEAR